MIFSVYQPLTHNTKQLRKEHSLWIKEQFLDSQNPKNRKKVSLQRQEKVSFTYHRSFNCFISNFQLVRTRSIKRPVNLKLVHLATNNILSQQKKNSESWEGLSKDTQHGRLLLLLLQQWAQHSHLCKWLMQDKITKEKNKVLSHKCSSS